VVTLTFDQISCARNDIAHPMGCEFTSNRVGGFLPGFVEYFVIGQPDRFVAAEQVGLCIKG
jgi:hypothetical protein